MQCLYSFSTYKSFVRIRQFILYQLEWVTMDKDDISLYTNREVWGDTSTLKGRWMLMTHVMSYFEALEQGSRRVPFIMTY